MSQTAVLEKKPAAAPNATYPALPVNGETVQVCKDMVLEFTDDNDHVIQAVVAPTPAGEKVPTGFFRSPGGVDELYYIVPVLALRINGEWSKKGMIAVAYSDRLRKLVLLFPAVDVLRDERGHEKIRQSPLLYRAVDPDTGKTVKSQRITSVAVTNLVEVGLAP